MTWWHRFWDVKNFPIPSTKFQVIWASTTHPVSMYIKDLHTTFFSYFHLIFTYVSKNGSNLRLKQISSNFQVTRKYKRYISYIKVLIKNLGKVSVNLCWYQQKSKFKYHIKYVFQFIRPYRSLKPNLNLFDQLHESSTKLTKLSKT